MSSLPLYAKYAPIMHFARREGFFPMRVDDLVAYSSLHEKGDRRPLVPAGRVQIEDLAPRRARDVFLFPAGGTPVEGIDVARQWGLGTLTLLWEYGRSPSYNWSESVARKLYDWFSPKTEAATKRFWWNKLVMRAAQDMPPASSPASSSDDARRDLPRFRLPDGIRESARDSYDRSQRGRPEYTYYYRLAPMGGYLDLQYWFFYGYNDLANTSTGSTITRATGRGSTSSSGWTGDGLSSRPHTSAIWDITRGSPSRGGIPTSPCRAPTRTSMWPRARTPATRSPSRTRSCRFTT